MKTGYNDVGCSHCDHQAASVDVTGATPVAAGRSQSEPPAEAVRSWCSEADPAQAQRRRRMVELLLRRGDATNLPGDEPWATPLSWATRHSRGEIIELLKQHGAT